VLLDVMLPGVDGFEVCHRLRREPTTSEVPILLISAKGRDEDVETGLRVGATAYLRKPISRVDLLAAIEQHLVGPKGIA
jgi:DNA-binding response OmpR family regulator